MTKFGLFCPPTIGHLNPACAVALELQRRGHQVVLFSPPDGLAKVAGVGLETWEIGADVFPAGSLDRAFKTLGTLTGSAGLKFTIDLFKQEAEMLFAQAPGAIKAAGIEVLLVDQISLPLGTVADHLGLPFVTLCNALPVYREPEVPPYSTTWAYAPTFRARLRNRLGNRLVNFLTRGLWQTLVDQRRQWTLPPYRQRNDAYSPLAQLAQLPASFDFPRRQLPPQFHYLGRFQDPSGQEPIAFGLPPFPFERLEADGRPLIYASLGTLQNQRPEIFELIARACAPLDAQLVISLGSPQAEPVALPGDPIVVPFAPHQQLIQRSALVITHAGMNTVLTALGCGVPMLAIPITNEQPGIAARLAHSGAGQFLALKTLDEAALQGTITHLLTTPTYRQRAQALQQDIQAAGGIGRAADILEAVVETRRPVLAAECV